MTRSLVLPVALIALAWTAAKAAGADLALVGRLLWSDPALGWIAEWRLATAERAHRWQVRGVSFDDAFRSGLRGAAQSLAGHGPP
jgi:hypothetical protein